MTATGRLGQKLRFLRQVALLLLWTALCAPVQSVLLLLPGDAKRGLARLYWSGVSWLLGVKVRVVGQVAAGPVLFAANHSSWLDIATLGGTLPACFVAKGEVGEWPLIRTVARLGRTVFVSRRAADTGRERDSMRARLAAGDSLILFPEGTSSDGARVLPFRSSFFSVADARDGTPPWPIQPVSVVYDRLDGLPATHPVRVVSAWYGGMDLGSHVWRLAAHRTLRATILLHEPVDPAAFPSRKALSQSVWKAVADGAAALRQGRQADPRPAPARPAEPTVSLDRPPSVIATVARG